MSAAQPLPIAPGATLDISWDWSAWLAVDETITSRTVTVGTGMTKVSDSVVTGVVTAMVTAPATSVVALDTQLAARCSITTSAGRTDSRKFLLVLTDR